MAVPPVCIVKRYRRDPVQAPPRLVRPQSAPAHHRSLAEFRVDAFQGVSNIRPIYAPRPVLGFPIPRAHPRTGVARPCADCPLPRPSFRSNRRSQSYPSLQPRHAPAVGPQLSSPIITPHHHKSVSQSVSQDLPNVSTCPATSFTTHQVIHSHRRQLALKLWTQLCNLVAFFSPVLQTFWNTSLQDPMLSRLIASFSDSTLLKYLPQVLHFFECLVELDIKLDQVQPNHVLEILWSLQDDPNESLEGMSSFSCIRALRWAVKLLQFPFPDLYMQPFASLTFAESERKEAMPLPLFVLQYWEKCIIESLQPVDTLIFIGAALLCFWSSLRFSDAQHVLWSKLMLDDQALRGLSFRTKTCRTGMAFGINLHGFFAPANSAERSWVVYWLLLLDHQWTQIHNSYSMTPDFLFASVHDYVITGPLPYCGALKMLRFCINLVPNSPLTPSIVNNFTLHSLKCTMLSWLAQLHLPPEVRASQGHHTFVHSVQLYSRDDVYASLHAQAEVRQALDNGWTPTIPLARGSQIPMQYSSISFSVTSWPSHPDSFCMFSVPSLLTSHLINNEPEVDVLDFFSAPTQWNDLHDDHLGTASPDPYPTIESAAAPRIRYLRATTVAHAAIKDAGCPLGYRAKCGALGSFELLDELPSSCRLCQRKACIGTFHHYE